MTFPVLCSDHPLPTSPVPGLLVAGGHCKGRGLSGGKKAGGKGLSEEDRSELILNVGRCGEPKHCEPRAAAESGKDGLGFGAFYSRGCVTRWVRVFGQKQISICVGGRPKV